jgi:hypothetical protein
VNCSFGKFRDMFRSMESTFRGCAGAAVGAELTVRGRWRSGTRRHKYVRPIVCPMFLNGPFHQRMGSSLLEMKPDSAMGLAPEPAQFNHGGRYSHIMGPATLPLREFNV